MSPRGPTILVTALLASCHVDTKVDGRPAPVEQRPAPPPAVSASTAPAAPKRAAITLIAGGDVSFGRLVGRMLIDEPSHDFFTRVRPWLDAADVRFANLEGPISDQRGEVVRPGQPLVFNGPPEAAPALRRARFTVMSTANNHAWDYGGPALLETLSRLDAEGIAHAGTGADREASRRPAIIEVEGFRLAVLAVTDIWNDGSLAKHPAEPMVARADPTELAAAVRALREAGTVDAIVVSHHGGVEYEDQPMQRTVALLRGAIDAGADVVIGHHPHVTQGIEWYRGRPIFYSLGNFLMRMHRDHRWTGTGLLARVVLSRGAPPRAAACPFRIHGVELIPLAEGPDRGLQEQVFFDHLRAISAPLGGVSIAPPAADGCADLTPVEAPR